MPRSPTTAEPDTTLPALQRGALSIRDLELVMADGPAARDAHTLQIAGATHLSFMDLPFLPLGAGSPVVPMLATTTIDPTRMSHITGEIVGAFFDQYLDLHPNQLLERPDLIGPEVTLGAPSLAVTTMSDGGR